MCLSVPFVPGSLAAGCHTLMRSGDEHGFDAHKIPEGVVEKIIETGT